MAYKIFCLVCNPLIYVIIGWAAISFPTVITIRSGNEVELFLLHYVGIVILAFGTLQFFIFRILVNHFTVNAFSLYGIMNGVARRHNITNNVKHSKLVTVLNANQRFWPEQKEMEKFLKRVRDTIGHDYIDIEYVSISDPNAWYNRLYKRRDRDMFFVNYLFKEDLVALRMLLEG